MKFTPSTLRWVCFGALCLVLQLNNATASMKTDEFDDIPAVIDNPGTSSLTTDNVGDEDSEFVAANDDVNMKSKTVMSYRQLLLASGDISGHNHFFIELFFLCILGICIWQYFAGKMTNRNLAIKWITVHKELFAEQFSLISAASNADPNDDELLSQEKGYNNFQFYASGRQHCTALLAEVTLLKRNDIFWRIIDALAFPVHDKVTMQFVLEDSPSCHPSLFFLCRKGKQVAIREENPFFQEFTSQASVSNLNSDLVMFAEVHEVIEKMLTPEDLKLINELSDFVELISVTDLNTEMIEGVAEKSPPKKVLTCVFRLPASSDMATVLPLTTLVLQLVDTLFTLRLSVGGANKVTRNRKVLTDRVSKALTEKRLLEAKEEHEQKKIAKLGKEKEEYEKLPSHLKQKRDQKDEKKKKKNEKKSMMKKK